MFQYQYGVNDPQYGPVFSQQEQRNDYNTAGEYRVNLPDGRVQIVSYTAGPEGYVADVKYEGEAQYPEEKAYAPAPYKAAPAPYVPAPAPYVPAPAPYVPAPPPAYKPAPAPYVPAPYVPAPAPYKPAPVYAPVPAYNPAPVYQSAPVYKPAPAYHSAPAPAYAPARRYGFNIVTSPAPELSAEVKEIAEVAVPVEEAEAVEE